MVGEWWVIGLPVFAPCTLHQQAHSSSHEGQRDGHHSPTLPLTVLVLLLDTQRGFASSHMHLLGDFPSFVHPHIGESFSLTFSCTRILCWFPSRREREKSWSSLRIFGCRSHSCSGLYVYVFHTVFSGRCMSPCRLWPCMLPIVVCVYVFSYQC